MANDRQSGSPGGLYEQRIGTPTTDDEVNGFWLFGFGVLLGLAGVLLFFLTESATTARGIAYALAALAPPFIMLGAVIRFPLRRAGTFIGYLGTTVSVLGVVWFVNIFPDGWSTASGEPAVIAVYGIGLTLIGLAGTIVPLLSDPVYEDYERMQGEAAAATAERDETSAELASTREELDATESELSATNEELSETESALEAARAETAALRGSKARFELFEDAGGKPRWRLRHRNGNVIATAGQGYSSRGKAQKGLHSVRRNALGAGILRIETPVAEAEAIAVDDGPEPADAADPNVAVPSDDEAIASKATFELFEDAGGEWRWRLRHDNGNIISDSGEGTPPSRTRSARSAGSASTSPPRTTSGSTRPPSRCSGTPAASGAGGSSTRTERARRLRRGYSSRSKARQGLDSVQSNAAEAALEAVGDDGVAGDADGNPNATFELYEDAAEEYRWRLRHRNGNIIADSGEGYASESNARDAIGRVREYAPTPTCWRSATPPSRSTRTPPTSGAGGSATATGTSSRTPAKGTPPGRTRSRGHGREGERPGAEAETVEAEE